MKFEKKGKILVFVIPIVLVLIFIFLMKDTEKESTEIEDITSFKKEAPKEEKIKINKIEGIDNLKDVEKKIKEEKNKIDKKNISSKENSKIKTKKENKNKIKKMELNKEYTTESGLKYEILKLGTGKKPTLADSVEVHYVGKLENGNIFDSSVQRGEKITFPLNSVIDGWKEGIQLMPVGSKFKFTIPADLAYGDRALPGIPANSTLIFEVELFSIK